MRDDLKLFDIEYQDESGDSPVFTQRVKAYDREHAEMKFYDSPDADGWVILRIRSVATPVAGTATVSHTVH